MNSTITKATKIGFIGIGNMGSRIARRLIERGYALTVYDKDFERASALATNRATLARNVADLAREANVVMSCLTNDDAVRNVYLGPDGVLANARFGSVILEMSTVSPDSSRLVYRE